MRTSAVATSFFKTATPSARLRSSTRPRLLRLTARNGADTPGAACRSISRVVSPPGASILMTSAPMSARSIAQNGPAITWVWSRTRKPCNARGWSLTPGSLQRHADCSNRAHVIRLDRRRHRAAGGRGRLRRALLLRRAEPPRRRGVHAAAGAHRADRARARPGRCRRLARRHGLVDGPRARGAHRLGALARDSRRRRARGGARGGAPRPPRARDRLAGDHRPRAAPPRLACYLFPVPGPSGGRVKGAVMADT